MGAGAGPPLPVELRDVPPGGQGGALQLHPIKPTLKPPGTKHLELKYDKPLSNLAFKFNSRRYTKGGHLELLRWARAHGCPQ